MKKPPLYSPCAIRLRTESAWEEGLSRLVPGASPAPGAAGGSPVWKERYSCIMYRGYGTRWDDERIPGPGLGLAARAGPWVRARAPGRRARSTPHKHSDATSISTQMRNKVGEISEVLKEPREERAAVPPGVWCGVVLSAEPQPGLFIADSCPLMTP